MGLQASMQTTTNVPGEQRGCRKVGEQKKSSLTRVTKESWSPHEGKRGKSESK